MHRFAKARIDSFLSHHARNRSTIAAVVLVFTALCLHGMLITNYVMSKLPTTTQLSGSSQRLQPIDGKMATTQNPFPPLFIYRRTRKTGSSSMLAALVQQLVPLGYTPLYHTSPYMEMVVRSEFRRTHPRPLFIAEHNRVTRNMHPKHAAVIADTVRDGYKQITAFCRHTRHVATCDSAMLACLRSRPALQENLYRWATRDGEDEDTYIDLPLSSAHPALSTTVLRTVFPNVTLQVEQYNSANKTCPELAELRAVYEELYGELDRQIAELKKRLLIITGYPYKVKSYTSNKISIDEVLDAAEVLERPKYDISDSSISIRGISSEHKDLFASKRRWERGEDGGIFFRSVLPGRAEALEAEDNKQP